MINWPAVIKYHGDDELGYIDSESEWNCDPDLSACDYDSRDGLIDSHGCVYRLDNKENGVVHPVLMNNSITLCEFIKLVKLHASDQGQCCIEKIVFNNIKDGIQLVSSLVKK